MNRSGPKKANNSQSTCRDYFSSRLGGLLVFATQEEGFSPHKDIQRSPHQAPASTAEGYYGCFPNWSRFLERGHFMLGGEARLHIELIRHAGRAKSAAKLVYRLLIKLQYFR